VKYKRLTLLSIIFAILLTPGSIPTGQAQFSSVDLAFPSVESLDDVKASSPGSFVPGQIDVDTNLGGFEPHVAVNPFNSANVAVAQGSNVLLSTDSGATFPSFAVAQLPPTLVGMGYGICGDPVLTFDSQGRLFWTYLPCLIVQNVLTDLSVAVLQINPITGAAIGNAVDVTPGNNVDDKQWIAADANPLSPFKDNLYLVWADFTPAGVGPVTVMFSMSTNQGVTWTTPSPISLTVTEGFTWPPHITVAPNGDVFANYPTNRCQTTGTVQVLRDTNGGAQLAAGTAMNLFQKTTAFANQQARVTCNVQHIVGNIPQTDFWLQGSGAAYTIADPLTPGRIYVIGNDDPNNVFGNGDDGDVVMVTSTNSGGNWGAPVTISHGPGTSLQVMPTGAIDPQGNIIVSWYDTRAGATNAGGNFLLDLFTTISRDGGVTFSNPDVQINDAPFDPDLNALNINLGGGSILTLRIGEYNGIDAANCVASLAWTGNDVTNNQQEIFFDTLTCPVVCGDGIVDPPETCDDGNTIPGDGCDAQCQIEPVQRLPVGGELIPIEQTSLILAGAQTFSWMIPVILSGIGIGLFVVSRKSE